MASGSHSTSGTDGTNGTSFTVKSSRRGIVNMLKIKKARSKGIVQKVSWNELGQPIGKESTSLSYFIGSYARLHVPITCSNWRKKDLRNIKEALWDEVKQTFDGIEEEHKEKIISRAGTLHRQFRTRLRDLSRDEDGNYSVEPPLLYAHLSTVAPYWKEFVESSTDEVFVEKSTKNKVQAEAMEARYKKACVGYARIREIIIAEKIKAGETNPVVSRLDAWEYARRNASGVVDDPVTLQGLEDVIAISNQLEEHELTNIGTDDLLARLIPLEYPGRVRAVGWGVTKTSLQKHSSGSEITKLKNDIAFLKNEIKELKCKGYIPGAHSGGSSHMDNFAIDNDVSGDLIDDHDTVLIKDLPERLQDLHKAYAEMMLVASREADAKIMAAETKAQRLEQELQDTKNEAVHMMAGQKKIMDAKISEAKMASWNQQQKINELEAQLHEAEDIITVLREKLRHVQVKCERESRNGVQHSFEDNRQSQSLPCGPLELEEDSLVASNKENLHLNQESGYLKCCGEVIQMRNLYGTMPEVPSILRRSKKDKFISCRSEAQAIDLILKTATDIKCRKKEPALNKRIPDKLFRKLHETPGVAISDHTPVSVENGAQNPVDTFVPIVQEGASKECLDIQVSKPNLNKADESTPPPELKTIGATSKGSPLQLFKYTLQRKRKRETVRISDGNVPAENLLHRGRRKRKKISADQNRVNINLPVAFLGHRDFTCQSNI